MKKFTALCDHYGDKDLDASKLKKEVIEIIDKQTVNNRLKRGK